MDRKDVLDETYRKAGKLDAAHFAIQFDLERSGLAGGGHTGLLEGHDEKKAISAELYKLNVYGKDSFFKAHKDTPLADYVREPRIAYIAFYSDVEHEVALVTSGYRVTITYNLYFAESPSPNEVAAHPLSTNETELKAVFQSLLVSYSLPSTWKEGAPDVLKDLARCLKGGDAVLMKVCRELGLDASLQMTFEDEFELLVVMCDQAVNFDEVYMDDCISDFLRLYHNGKIVSYLKDRYHYYDKREKPKLDLEVHWVTKRTDFNRVHHLCCIR
ncbi:hypothetical protein A0H81_08862 [Grifola frondosa]|uniref:Prolyl 4-hydroxylase alpha subunit Fe(2+) 2OG dioxygenase domain-containing protein n=1 Tax=Grifola frondosa TaxID=5627 RepID=A0A1C7M4B4_GRIFR|nr:hypothetical protein A0H81_08862 [Grifola frondosa]